MAQHDEAYQRLMEFMLAGRDPVPKQISPTKTPARPARPRRRTAKVSSKLDSELRALGFNRPEREQLRRGQKRSTTPNKDREKARALLRFEFYINQQVDWGTTDLDRKEVIAAWADLCDHDIDKANQLWAQGVHPLDIAYIQLLKDNGFEPTDLYRLVNGRTVLQHFHDGQSNDWCLGALHFAPKS